MRTNLHTGKPGKEIELAWLKGVAAFLNTEGGILLMGVADDGEVLGLEADAFANDDKCRLHFKNLVNQHLGPEYARFLRFELFQLADRQIAAVECEQADVPAFLRHNQGETFLIRSGPSSIELPISRALVYIRGRF
jgi:predicted HTH transcriptional regulator